MAEGKYKGLPSREYWIARSEELENAVYKNATSVDKELEKVFLQALADCMDKIDAFLQRYATENKMTLQEAEKALQGVELDTYMVRMKSLLAKYQATKNPFILADIQKLTAQGQITRLEALMNELTVQIGLLTHNQQITIEEFLSETYEDSYYRSIYNVQSGIGVGVAFAKVNKDAVIEAIQYKWSGDMFSSRIWKNKDNLITALRQELTVGLVQGRSTQNMSRNLKEKLGTSYSNANRIIRTEANFIMNEGTAKGYQASGFVQKYEFVATLDKRTSKTCGSLDGKVYNLEDKQVGVNYPPLHPYCRSTVCPYFPKDATAQRIARDATGQTYYIPASMTYEEWKKTHSIQ
jgi:SPP1 gp7 family putative phage head morphogenesis protein